MPSKILNQMKIFRSFVRKLFSFEKRQVIVSASMPFALPFMNPQVSETSKGSFSPNVFQTQQLFALLRRSVVSILKDGMRQLRSAPKASSGSRAPASVSEVVSPERADSFWPPKTCYVSDKE